MAASEWRSFTLDQLGFVGRGRSRHRPRDDSALYGGPYPFFQTGDVKAAGLYLRESTESYNELGLAQSKLWEPGTLCITIAANIAETAILGVKGCFPDSIVGFVPNPDKADVRYIKYYIDTVKLRMQNVSHGTTQDNLSLDKLLRVEFLVPPLALQREIAGVLSAYDEYISNSVRRVRLLEQMAVALYREWFVALRFPGYGSTPPVVPAQGGLPNGWEVTTLGSQLTALESGKRPKGGVGEFLAGVPSIGAENINGIGRYDFNSEKFVVRDFFLAMRKGVVHDRDVAIYKDGAYIGKSSYFRDGFPHAECCVNEHVFLLRAEGRRLTQNSLYLWLQNPETVSKIRATNANAAQPGINQASVSSLKITIPDPKTARLFDDLVEPLLADAVALAMNAHNLTRMRNMLLPRLIDGQIKLPKAETVA